MIKHGRKPYLECSSRGDKRFSAFYAEVTIDGVTKTIERWYQTAKVFEAADGSKYSYPDDQYLRAKGKRPINVPEVSSFYSTLWDMYVADHRELWEPLVMATGLSDYYGKPGSACQATELWRIRGELITRAVGLLMEEYGSTKS